MQDVIDVWLKVQAAWLYLEPIFSSEDIMAQMPAEGRRFRTVDAIWKDCMKVTAEDPLVLNATDQPGLLANLNQSLELLDLIQKGLLYKCGLLANQLFRSECIFGRKAFIFSSFFLLIK